MGQGWGTPILTPCLQPKSQAMACPQLEVTGHEVPVRGVTQLHPCQSPVAMKQCQAGTSPGCRDGTVFTRPWDEQWERFWDLVKMMSDSSSEPQHIASQALSGTQTWGWLRAGDGHGNSYKKQMGRNLHIIKDGKIN